LLLVLVVITLILMACTNGNVAAVTETRTVTVQIDEEMLTVEQPVGCTTESGSPIDINAEPAQ